MASPAMIPSPATWWTGVDFSPWFHEKILDGALLIAIACLSFSLLFGTYVARVGIRLYKRRSRLRRKYGRQLKNRHRRNTSSGSAGTMTEPPRVLPAVIIESEAEHEQNDSHDTMLDAENAIIRKSVQSEGIVWAGAFRALKRLKRQENHHLQMLAEEERVAADGGVEEDPFAPKGHILRDAMGSWISQGWPTVEVETERSSNGAVDGEGVHRTVHRRRRTLLDMMKQHARNGKKDFVQALLAWSIVALLYVRAILFDDTDRIGWSTVPADLWVYFTLLLEVRQYAPLFYQSPFLPRLYTTLSWHVGTWMIVYSLVSLLDFRSTLILQPGQKRIVIQSILTALSLAVLGLELLTPQSSDFIRKSKLKQQAEERKIKQKAAREREGEADESSASLLEEGQRDKDYEPDDYTALLALMPEDDTVSKDGKLPSEKPAVEAPPPTEVGASLFSLATFYHFAPFIYKHVRIPPTFNDVPDLRADDKSASVVLEFRGACKNFPSTKWLGGKWLRTKGKDGRRKRAPIFLQIIWYFRYLLLPQVGWAFLAPFLAILPSVFIKLLLQWATARERGDDAPVHVAVLFIAGLFVSQMAGSLVRSQSLIIGRRLCIRAKALIIAEVFTKTLRRKDLAGKALVEEETTGADPNAPAEKAAEGEGPATAGKVQNLVSVDASRIAEQFAYLHFFFPEAPLTIVVALSMLFNIIGFSAFAAVGTMILLFPFQTAVARFFMRYQNQVLVAGDARLSLTTEVFQAIKVIKFFAWEERFNDMLKEKRQTELAALRRRVIAFAAGGISMFGAPILISLVTFVFHTKVLHQRLDATTAFTALALFNVIRAPLDQAADQLSAFISTLVSCARVDALLEEEETAKYAIVTSPTTAGDPKIGFVNAVFTWADAETAMAVDSTSFKLQNLNLRFAIDGLNLVVGTVGSGKSSLLYALLGEMNLLNGKCFIPSPVVREAGLDPSTGLTDTVAFCAQTPWLLNDTIRNNILFGSAYNAKRYRHVLWACALLPDIKVMDLGDKTQVGEKGTVLSGGQKARISLARAVYSSAKVLLLDDVLSAVDAHTARHLYHNCLTSDQIMRGRTRILVTHALHLTVPLADYVVALTNGYVAFDGPANDYVLASGQNTPGLANGSSLSTLDMKAIEERAAGLTSQDTYETMGDAAVEQMYGHEIPNLDEHNPLLEETLLTQSEKSSTGAVSLGVYTFYAKAFGSLPVIIALVAVIVLTEAASVGSNWALRLWASSFDRAAQVIGFKVNAAQVVLATRSLAASLQASADDYETPDYYLRIYVVLAALALVLFGIRVLFFLWRGTIASKHLYNGVMATLLAAPVRFYDQTPLGRIMNRLSKDMETVDQEVPSKTLFFVFEIFGTLSVILAIGYSVPAFLIAGVFIGLGYCLVGWLYIATSRELKRIEAVTRSPVYSLVGECLMGVTSIRAYSDSSRFTAQLFKFVDDSNRPFFALWLANRWLSVRSDFGGAIVGLCTASFIVMTPSVSASLAGFALTYALLMEERILWIVRLYASTQINMNSVERIREYTLDMPQESTGGKEPPAYWPSSHSSIVVEKLGIRYTESLPPALKGVSFEVKPSERVAIVGRTGSGKSTLALSFFRFVEAFQGSIVIDGIDIATIPLRTLRERLTIIPQDAALFSGSIRFNLDPFGQFSDAELYDVLRRTNLLNSANNDSSRSSTPTSSTKKGGVTSLDDQVQEGAKNFSAGQRQLLCLARGLLKLRNSNLLVLDESTANLDQDTDIAVQKTIREEMGDATILCIAHRLQTIIDFDRVLVLAQGEVVEYDTPAELLKKEDSEFYKLCKETGDFDKLQEAAFAHAQGSSG